MIMQSPARVVLIEPGSPGLNIYSHLAMGRGVPLLATVLRDDGYPVQAFVEDISGKDSVDWEAVRRADVVGFSAITCTLSRTAELIAETKRHNPVATIVLGGPEPTCAPQRSFDAGADYVIRGEAEFTLPQFLRALEHGSAEELHAVAGIVWREGDQLRFGPAPSQLNQAELSALPLVDMSLVSGAQHVTTGLAWRSRGCPERCSFCEVCEIWPHYTLRDEERSVEELIGQEPHPAGAFLIDDNAAGNKVRFKRFLRGIMARGYAQPLAIQLRADAVFDQKGRLDRELLKLLRDVAPVTMLCIGVESAEDSDLSDVDKHETSQLLATSLSAMRRYGLLVHGMFIAFAGDTAETLRRNGEFARKYVSSLQYLFETPLPGTKSTAQHEAAGRVLFHDVADLKFLDGMHVALRPEHMSAKEMQQFVTAEYRKFYSRARIVRAFFGGLLLRYRRLGEGQRIYLRNLPPFKRVAQWAWLHLQFKLAPWAFLRVGRRRVLEFLRDAEYAEYLGKLEG